MTYEQLSELLHRSVESLKTAYAEGQPYLPPKYKVGARVYFKRDEVMACLLRVQ